jgi:hypothetical protein
MVGLEAEASQTLGQALLLSIGETRHSRNFALLLRLFCLNKRYRDFATIDGHLLTYDSVYNTSLRK